MRIDRKWHEDYMDRYRAALFDTDVFNSCLQLRDLAIEVKTRGGKLMLAGNGASAVIASHAAGDFTKQAGVTAVTFHDPNLITMMANDYGYDQWVSRSIEAYHRPGDAVVLISSSGSSRNIVAAAIHAAKIRLPVVTLTGFEANNPLKSHGSINFWLDSRAYNVIENTHMIWLTTVVDMLVGNAEYSVSPQGNAGAHS